MQQRFEKFSERARRVLKTAQAEADRLNANYIGTEHLLLALVKETDGVAAKVLAKMKGYDILDKIRSNTEFIIGRGEKPASNEIGLTPRAKKVIELAVDETRHLNHNYIGTEHLLIGLLREGESLPAEVLKSFGIKLLDVQLAVNKYLEDAKKPYIPRQAQTGKEDTINEELANELLLAEKYFTGKGSLNPAGLSSAYIVAKYLKQAINRLSQK